MSRQLLHTTFICFAVFTFTVLPFTVGCGSGNGSAEPVTDVDELTEFLNENPELDVNLDEDEEEENL